MEDEQAKSNILEETKENNIEKQKKKFNKNKFFIIFGIFILLLSSIYLYFLSTPLKSDNLYCEYKEKFNKITCVQTGDIVPEWLNVDDNQFLKYLGIGSEYSMKLVLSHSNKDYKVLDMKDKIFITDMNRKFIYELPEQTFEDWIDFKRYVSSKDFQYSNWGSIILYCSENNMKEEICQKLKKQFKK